jgi:hypothetical protein
MSHPTLPKEKETWKTKCWNNRGTLSKKKLGGWQRKKKLGKQNVEILEAPAERKTLGEE